MGDRSVGIDGKAGIEGQMAFGHERLISRNSRNDRSPRMSLLVLVLIVLMAPLHGGRTSYSQNDIASNPGPATSLGQDEFFGTMMGSGDTFDTVTFPVGSYVIPMDDKQNDVLKAFGFTHALLRNGTYIYRIIEPPDIVIETVFHPSMEIFAGGPILVMPGDAAVVNMVRLRFPTVSLDNTIAPFSSDTVDKIIKPTKILVIYGVYGHTQDVLTDMEIPFTLVSTMDVENDPNMLFDYDVVVDDCPGWFGMPFNVVDSMRAFAKRGGEIIFTDIALLDMNLIFPGYLSVVGNMDGTWPCSIYRIPEFPGQYYGPSTMDIYTMWGGEVMGNVLDPSVRVMIDSSDYNGEYRILAAYFYYGASANSGGIVEGFGFHPGDQPPDARVMASILFGNKFVHLPIMPDLEISPPEIVFNPVSPVLTGTPVTVNATIHNVGNEDAYDVIARFYDGAPASGIQIGSDQTIPFIESDGGFGHAEVGWTAVGAGTHDIYVVVDPDNAILESNEANNVAYNSIEVFDFLPPMLYVKAAGDDIVLNWTQNQTIGLSHYLLYRAPSQTEFDFTEVWINTSVDVNPMTGMIDPLNPVWIDTNVTKTGDPDYRDEYYYIVRAVNVLGARSRTSNTVGYYIVHFGTGMNTFSLPLQPLETLSLNAIMTDIGAVSISVLDDSDRWQTFTSDPFLNAQLGRGYVVELNSDDRYVFTGEPASMIFYNEGLGFDEATRDDIVADVDALGNVYISWTPISGADVYEIYRSSTRRGFFTASYDVFMTTSAFYFDPWAAASKGELYYMIMPYNAVADKRGSSTYSIGVITEEYNGNEMFGLPLKPVWGDMSADWYIDEIPNCLGIVYLEDGNWKAHFKEFPEGAYDTVVEVGKGYELSVFATSLYSYIGW